MTKPLLRGVLKTWKEDRGFGFITPDNGGRDVFIHISAIGDAVERRPKPGDIIEYQIARDKHGKFRAINAHIDQHNAGVYKSGRQPTKSSAILIAVTVIVLIIVLAGTTFFYWRTQGQL